MSQKTYPNQIIWDDLPERVAILSALNDAITNCTIQCEGKNVAYLFLLNDGLLALTEITLPNDLEPDNGTLLAMARVIILHRRACREGRKLT